MEIVQQNIRSITLNFIDDSEDGVYEVDAFLTSLPKIRRIINSVGFKNDFTKEEKAIWKEVFSKFVFSEDVKGNNNVQNINNLTSIVGKEDL